MQDLKPVECFVWGPSGLNYTPLLPIMHMFTIGLLTAILDSIVMNDFRKDPRRYKRQAVDGILGAPRRPQLSSRPLGRRPALHSDTLRTTPRTIGDFKRPEGYHAANQSAAGHTAEVRPKPAPSAQSRNSILHMTLPGAKTEEKKSKRGSGKRNWRLFRRNSLRAGIVVAAMFLLIGGFLVVKGYFKLNKVFKGGGNAASLQENVNPSLLKGEGDGRVNILLMGKGGDEHEGADLTDTIIMASIDPVNKKAALVSLPRDLWVSVPGYGSRKINSIYALAKQNALSQNPKDKDAAEKAGITKLQGVVSQVFDMPVHYYGMVDFIAFKQAVDTVGGVDINITSDLAVSERLWDETTRKNYYLNVTPGQQHFDGQRALFFTRSRHTSARGDFDRAERQRVFISALSQKVLSAGTYTNPVKVSQLLDNFGDRVSTDMSIDDAMRLMSIMKGAGGNYESIGLSDPGRAFLTTGMISGQSVVLPVAGVGNYKEIQTYVHSHLKDGYILRENANISVLNGTSVAGLASSKADQLKYYGYNVGTVGDAPSSYQKTTIIDLSGGKKPYTKNYLEKRFGVKVVTKLPDTAIQPGNASFVIILGQNETSTSQN